MDAICINQADIDERSQQVETMRDIFQLCDTVLIWLGPYPSEHSPNFDYYASLDPPLQPAEALKKEMGYRLKSLENGIDIMEKISQKDISTLKDMEERMERQRDLPLASNEEHTMWLMTGHELGALEAVFRHSPIWTRVWIMQEIACGRQVVLVGGNSSLNWDKVSSFLGNTRYADAFHGPFGHGSVAKVASSIFSSAQVVEHQRGVVRDINTGYISTLLDVLARFKSTEATDPRDKIYGLLGLVSEKHSITPDYNQTYQQVFTEVVTSLINRSGNLDILCQSPWSDYSNFGASGLPSWVADFTQAGHPIPLFAQRSTFNAGSATCKTPCNITSGGALALNGVALGKIGPILPGYTDGQSYRDYWEQRDDETKCAYEPLPRQWMQQYFGDSLLDAPTSTYISGESSLQAYWCTLLASCKFFPIKRLSDEDIHEYGKTFTSVLRGDSADEILGDQEYWKMLSRMLMYWTFTMTTDGLYVMVMSHVKEGDLIAVLEGAKVPMVLRPVSEGQIEGGQVKYQLISTAYVHGFMDGEAARWVNEGKRHEEEFLLV